MVDSRLVLGVHVLVALGLLVFGVIRFQAGNPVGGSLNVVMAVIVVVVGTYFARRQ